MVAHITTVECPPSPGAYSLTLTQPIECLVLSYFILSFIIEYVMRTLYDITFERDDVTAYAILSVRNYIISPFQ